MSNWLASQVWRYKLDLTTTAVLGALCDIAQNDGTDCYPRPHYIAYYANVSRPTVYRTIEKLEKMGVLVAVGRRGEATEYHIHLDLLQLKPPYERPRTGRPPRKVVSERDDFSEEQNSSLTEKSFLSQRKVFSHREKFSLTENQNAPARKPQTQAPSGATKTRAARNLDMESGIDPEKDPDRPPDTKKSSRAEPEPERRPVATPAFRTIPAASPPAPSSAAPLPPSPAPPTTLGGQEDRATWERIVAAISASDGIKISFMRPARLFRFPDDSWLLMAHSATAEMMLDRYRDTLCMLLGKELRRRVRLVIRARDAVRAQENILV